MGIELTPAHPNSHHAAPTPLLSERDAARYLSMSVFFLRQARVKGRGPAFARLGRSIRYHLRDLDLWLDRHVVRPAA